MIKELLKFVLYIISFLSILQAFGFIFFCVGELFSFIFRKNRERKLVLIYPFQGFVKTRNKYIIFCLIILFIVGSVFTVMIVFFPKKEIGSLIEKEEYQAQYYVNINSKNNPNSYSKVKADIAVFPDAWLERRYYIVNAYFENRKSLSFERSVDISPLELGKKIKVFDDNDGWWYIELTNEKVKN